MHPVALFEDPAGEQLFDEILARVYAIAEFAPAAQPADATAHRVVAERAEGTVRLLRQAPTSEVIRRLSLLLWSCGSAPRRDDPWWCTPLGELLAASCALPADLAPTSVATFDSSAA